MIEIIKQKLQNLSKAAKSLKIGPLKSEFKEIICNKK
jgi:hypothetical protein